MDRPRRTSFNEPGHAHFLTFSCFRRCQVFTDDEVCRLFAETLDRARELHDFDLWVYVIMPDHVHLLIRPRRSEYRIAIILKGIKAPFEKWLLADWKEEHPTRLRRLSARTAAGVVHRVWQRGGGFDRNVYTYELVGRAVQYIEGNPVRKGLVTDPIQWKWSSACARSGGVDIPLRIDAIDRELTRVE
ncbi:MAG TPA: transposase [Acidobacteriota bacterium]|nr:transposase [Acidobacteriota bacterium]